MSIRSFDDGNSDEARQFLLDRKCERKHPKRHRTLKREKQLLASKKARVKARNDARRKAASRYIDAVRLYWAGLSNHPGDFNW